MDYYILTPKKAMIEIDYKTSNKWLILLYEKELKFEKKIVESKYLQLENLMVA